MVSVKLLTKWTQCQQSQHLLYTAMTMRTLLENFEGLSQILKEQSGEKESFEQRNRGRNSRHTVPLMRQHSDVKILVTSTPH